MNDITMWHLKIAARQLGGLLQESRMKAHLNLEEASAITKHGREKLWLLEEGKIQTWQVKKLTDIIDLFGYYGHKLKFSIEEFDITNTRQDLTEIKKIKVALQEITRKI